MTPSRPYLLRAMYEWLVDNHLTPYVMIDALLDNVQVPERFVEDGKIVLNISPQAVGGLSMTNESLSFDARFSGVAHHIHVPIIAVTAVYAFENGRGMVFNEEDGAGDDSGSTPPAPNGGGPAAPKGRPNLKIVK